MTATAPSLLLPPDTRVTCPKCEHEFSLEQGFAKQALESIESASLQSIAEVREREREASEKRAQVVATERERAAQQQLAEMRRLLKEQAEAQAALLVEARASAERLFTPQLQTMADQLALSEAKLAALDQREAALLVRERGIETRVAEAAAARAAELVATERQSYEKRLADRSAQVQTLQAEQVALRLERQQLQDQKEALALDVQKQVDAKLLEREGVVRSQERERSDLDKAELQKTIDDMKAKLAEAQRKAEQGSQQLQGEVLELALEEVLKREFTADSFEEVRKGARGADVLQRVMTRSAQLAGTILWEAKRAKDWGRDWPAKLKEDMRISGADVGILVTTTMPKEIPENQLFGLHEDVWVATWGAAVPLAAAIRERVLEVHKQRIISAGKGEKMEAVYDYVTSPQFAQKLRAVFDTFKRMRDELETEKSTTTQRWARREKQIGIAQSSLLAIGGDVQGLSQQALPELEMQVDETASDDT